jgi:hypothetical protein
MLSRCLAAWLSGGVALVRCPAIVNALSYILIHCCSMEYSGVAFAVRAHPGRDEWTWTIYLKNARAISREFTGSRDDAVRAARQKIDRWLTEHQARDVQGSKLVRCLLQPVSSLSVDEFVRLLLSALAEFTRMCFSKRLRAAMRGKRLRHAEVVICSSPAGSRNT